MNSKAQKIFNITVKSFLSVCCGIIGFSLGGILLMTSGVLIGLGGGYFLINHVFNF